ncbi:MAG TPA: RDD family protein [Lapillicoccus sp.]
MNQRAGWYDDPENPENLRYFDGVVWTTHTTPRMSPSAGQSTIGLAEGTPSRQAPTQQLPQEPTQQLPGDNQQFPPRDYGQPPYGQQPPYGHQQPPYGQQYGQYGQSGGPQYGPPGYPQGGYSAMPPAYATALGVKTTPDGVPLASYGQRVGAYLIDMLILAVLTTLAGWYWISQLVTWYTAWLSDLLDEAQRGVDPTINQADLANEIYGYVLALSLVSLVVTVVYQVAFLTWRGATPGKMALGIAVRLRDQPGNPSVLVALKRQIIFIGSSLLSLLPGVGAVGSLLMILNLLWPLWDDKRQALHDKIAATNVVVRRRGR